ncbi:MAG: hydrogenase expression/formation protein [Erythrobacter sp.]|jgi:hydrogenase-1 operon protein HyaF
MTGGMGALAGPGSQPEDFDGGKLEYMVMPDGMTVFSASNVPEPEDAASHREGVRVAEAILAALGNGCDGGTRIDLTHLDEGNLAFVDQMLGEGEVSVVAGDRLQAQESVLAGVWRIREFDDEGRRSSDYVECGAFPSAALDLASVGVADAARLPMDERTNIFNAPPLVAEINEHVPQSDDEGAEPHVINLSLLPHTEEDLDFLDVAMGRGKVVILSRGYGNCRIRSTGTRNCWWVQYFNSQDTLILNSIEISRIPEVALAASEDLADSAERLAEILDIYR